MIYCVEDDNGIRDLMTYTLAVSGYEAKGFPDSTGLWEALHTVRPELIMLDIMLPGEDGITILKKLRENSATADIPVIMATAKGTEYVLRRSAPHSSGVLTVGPIALDVVRHRVTVGGNEVTLTLKEFELLRLFAENKGVVFTRDQLLAHIWGVDYIGETRTVDVHIGTLRTKLGDAGELIETVRGVGYRMEER